MDKAAPATAGLIASPREDLCLDFANTRYWRGLAAPTEDLRGLDDVLRWAAAKGGVDTAIGDGFAAWWRDRPGEGDAAFTAALRLREMLFRLFAAVAGGRAAPDADIAALNTALATAAGRARMELRDGRFVWATEALQPGMPQLLSPALWSAADLLAGTRLDRVRQCGNPQCGWVFLDDSKSGNRRWCSMATCGNRAKAHRHYLKNREREG